MTRMATSRSAQANAAVIALTLAAGDSASTNVLKNLRSPTIIENDAIRKSAAGPPRSASLFTAKPTLVRCTRMASR
jgi:hypothetical protein